MIELPTDPTFAPRQISRAVLWTVGCLSWSMSYAEVAHLSNSEAALQIEADYRVIAARCGTPAFERQFSKQSKAAVEAGLVVSNKDAGTVEKAIESRRRNPLQLVSTGADCTEKLSLLKAVQNQRAPTLRTRGR